MTTKSQNEKVQGYLDTLEMINAEKFILISKLREVVFACSKDVGERIMYGGIMFSLEDDFGGLFVRKEHISFEFSLGYQMDDPNKLLEGKGKFRRHLKIRTIADIEDKRVEFFVHQSVGAKK